MNKATKGFLIVMLGMVIAYIGNSEIFSFLVHKVLDIFMFEYTMSPSKLDFLIRIWVIFFGVTISLIGVVIFKKNENI